jgi:phosphatidylinositol-4,5-bisphosphate 3-kinase
LFNLSDAELKDYLLQLVQVLKYEPNHISALACWLMKRALRNQIQIGHAFFWHLQAEIHVPEISERFGLLLEVYLRGCGEQREELLKQMEVIKKLKLVANTIKDTPSSRRKQVLEQQLKATSLPERFQIPLNPTYDDDESFFISLFSSRYLISFFNSQLFSFMI